MQPSKYEIPWRQSEGTQTDELTDLRVIRVQVNYVVEGPCGRIGLVQ